MLTFFVLICAEVASEIEMILKFLHHGVVITTNLTKAVGPETDRPMLQD
jgi:hypothetical protein